MEMPFITSAKQSHNHYNTCTKNLRLTPNERTTVLTIPATTSRQNDNKFTKFTTSLQSLYHNKFTTGLQQDSLYGNQAESTTYAMDMR